MIKALRYIWAVYFLLWFAVLFLLFYPLFRFYLSKPSRYPSAHALRRVWGRILFFVGGVLPSTTYEVELDPDATYVFTPNHFSYLDIVSVNTQMPYYFNFMAKSELGKIPLFKIFFQTIDVPVERRSLKGAKQAYLGASERLSKGVSILNFPEGSTSTTAPEMRKFKMGPFKLAIEHQVDVVPITLLDNWKRLPDDGTVSGGCPGRTRMHVHRPISTKGLKPGDEVALATQVYRIIEAKLKEVNTA